jgi:probable HAF family extracellular repeat protein
MWRTIGLSLAILASSSVLIAQSNRSRYAVLELSSSGSVSSLALGINQLGYVVGIDQGQAFLYDGRTIRLLGTLSGATNEGYVNSEAYGINSVGDVVGASSYILGSSTRHAFLYRNGWMQDLGTLPGAQGESYAVGINDLGHVVGFSSTAAANDSYRAFIYTAADGMRELDLPGEANFAYAINSAEQTTGLTSLAPGSAQAFLHAAGNTLLLGTLGGNQSWGNAINNQGWVVGGSTLSGPDPYAYHAFLYRDGRMTDIDGRNMPLDGTADSVAQGINVSGQIVGQFYRNLEPHAFVYSGGSMCDLNDLIPPNSGWVLQDATAINDAGQIVGWGRHGDNGRAFLLTPRKGNTGSGPCNSPSTFYYANGDSVASGHGLPGDPGPAVDSCRHAPDAYPRIVGRTLSSLGVADRGQFVYLPGGRRALGCSGTRTQPPAPDGDANKLLSTQVRTVISDLKLMRQDNPEARAIVSITVGANDFPWASLSDAPKLLCASEPDFDRSTNRIVAQITDSLQSEVDKVRRVGGVNIVLTTYHNPFNRESFYFAALRVQKPCNGSESNAALYQRIDNGIRKLNAALSNVALANSDLVALADVYPAFNVIGSHESPRALPGTLPGCGYAPPDFGQSWIQAPIVLWQPPWQVSSLSTGDCFHPNERGAVEYARSVVTAARPLLP